MTQHTRCTTQIFQHKSQWLSHLLALLLVLAAAPSMAGVRASLDRDTVYEGDIFTLTIESDGQSSSQQPDLAPLKNDFEVLGSSTSTQVSIFNGRRSDKTQWHVQLQPRRLGPLHIPPIDVGGEKTAAISLKVSEAPQQATAQAGQHVFIETEADTRGKPVYVQQQIPYTVRLYYDDRLQDGELSAPEPEDAVVERLGEENRYDTVRNGRQYHVIERNYVISAEKNGALHIPPASFRGHIALPQQQRTRRRARSPMEEFLNNSPFANDPFFRDRLGGSPFGNAFASPAQPISVRSRAIDMTIKPRPAAVRQNWLPAEAVTLTDSWTENTPQLKVGEPVSRTITIQAKGLSGSQIPELAVTTPADMRLYPEASTQENRTDGTTIYGVRTQTLTYISNAQGTLDIPAITLNWWDTRHDKAAHTTLPAWQFNVLPGAPGSAGETQAATSPPVTQPATKSSAKDALLQSGNNLLAETRKFMRANQRALIVGGGALLTLVILLTMLARRAKRRQSAIDSASNKPDPQAAGHSKQPDRKSALRKLKNACAANDRQAAARALLELGQAYWPDDAPRSLAALAARIEKGQVQLRELDHSLYAADTTAWNGATLWNTFRHGLQEKKATRQAHNDGLKPLYPNSL